MIVYLHPHEILQVAVSEVDDPTMFAFKKAAALLKDKREEESMCVEDRIEKWIRK
jgi:hypothetical protein